MEITLDIDKFAKDVVDKALNDIKLEGKTIREWVEIIAKQQICGDCISREEAINSVHKYFKDYLKLNDDICLDGLRSLPSVIPKGVTVTDFADRCRECGAEYGKMLEASKPKGGHWISHNEHCEKIGVKPSGLGAYIWCSNCDCGIDVGEFYRIHYNFCPNCGADMRETRESKKTYISEEIEE